MCYSILRCASSSLFPHQSMSRDWPNIVLRHKQIFCLDASFHLLQCRRTGFGFVVYVSVLYMNYQLGISTSSLHVATEDIFSSPFLIATLYSTPSFEVGRAYSTTINLFSVHLFNHDLSRIFVDKIRRMPGSASPVIMTDFSLENPPRPLLRLPRTWSSSKVLPV